MIILVGKIGTVPFLTYPPKISSLIHQSFKLRKESRELIEETEREVKNLIERLMKKHQEKLNVVDEKDNILGEETRENIHKKGLLHREIHVWVYNNKGEILFQRRSLDKDTYPGLLDASAGGHVELNKDYIKTALKELKEETGISAKEEDLVFLKMMRSKTYDNLTGNINNAIRAVYAYKYQRDLGELKIEKEKATSLEFWPLEKNFNITEKEKKQFIPAVFSKQILDILKKIKKLI